MLAARSDIPGRISMPGQPIVDSPDSSSSRLAARFGWIGTPLQTAYRLCEHLNQNKMSLCLANIKGKISSRSTEHGIWVLVLD